MGIEWLTKYIDNHIKIPTFALLNNLDFILYPDIIVVATQFFWYPGGVGIVTRPSAILGSKGWFIGSNS
jgi:hypothetical protein